MGAATGVVAEKDGKHKGGKDGKGDGKGDGKSSGPHDNKRELQTRIEVAKTKCATPAKTSDSRFSRSPARGEDGRTAA